MKAKGVKCSGLQDVLDVMGKRGNKKEENFWSILLDGANQVISVQHITKGLVNRCPVHSREVFYPAVRHYASAIIVCHNHPSGDAKPSREDDEITERLYKAAELLGFSFLDHVILAKGGGFYSYRQEGKLSGAEEDSHVSIANINVGF